WGVDANIIERFGQAGVPEERIAMTKDTYYFVSPNHGPQEFIDAFRRFYGPTMNAYEAAQKNGKVEELNKLLIELAKAQNKATDHSTNIPATFLRVSVRR